MIPSRLKSLLVGVVAILGQRLKIARIVKFCQVALVRVDVIDRVGDLPAHDAIGVLVQVVTSQRLPAFRLVQLAILFGMGGSVHGADPATTKNPTSTATEAAVGEGFRASREGTNDTMHKKIPRSTGECRPGQG